MVEMDYPKFHSRLDWSETLKVWAFYTGLCLYVFILYLFIHLFSHSVSHSVIMNVFIYLLSDTIVIHWEGSLPNYFLLGIICIYPSQLSNSFTHSDTLLAVLLGDSHWYRAKGGKRTQDNVIHLGYYKLMLTCLWNELDSNKMFKIVDLLKMWFDPQSYHIGMLIFLCCPFSSMLLLGQKNPKVIFSQTCLLWKL